MHSIAFVAVIAASLFTGGFAMAQSPDTIETRNKAAVQAGFDAWTAGTVSPYELLADNATWTFVGHCSASRSSLSRMAASKRRGIAAPDTLLRMNRAACFYARTSDGSAMEAVRPPGE